MHIASKTKKQHFISQAELGLNALNSEADKKDRKIYSFSIKDREAHSVLLDKKSGYKISDKLFYKKDLFSFHVLDKKYRLNFETLFGEYESAVSSHTTSLLEKIEKSNPDIGLEIQNLFICKFLNFFRNPYAIKMALHVSSSMRGKIIPTDGELQKVLRVVLDGNNPKQKDLCAQLGVSEKDYRDWLAVIFHILSLKDRGENFLETLAKALFENSYTLVHVHRYTSERCLVSDKGYIDPVSQEGCTAFDFNLTSWAFIQYKFIHFESYLANFSADTIARYKKEHSFVKPSYSLNNLDALDIYNKTVVYQSHKNVFCAAPSIYGVNVQAPE
ncbi:MAG: hypothetical protein RBS08_06505 [Bdellovibrionales bacterium]|jgi:hypothetical protein|nr:hypothetical protein [Bdellovibrionales bacterium]